MDRFSSAPRPAPEGMGRSGWPALLGLLLVIAVVAGWSVQRESALQREQAQARLAALAELHATQVEN